MFIVVLATAATLSIAVFLVAFTMALTIGIFAVAAIVTLTAAAMMSFKGLQFFFCCSTNGDNLNSKVQVLASQFVISIDYSLVAIDGLDSDRHRTSRGIGIELHTGLNLINTLEHAYRNFLGHTFVVLTITFGRNDFYIKLVAFFMIDHGLFEANDDHVSALDVLQRFAAFGRVD